MKSILRSFLVLMVWSTMLYGCYKDKGNYDYHPLNKLSVVEAENGTMHVMQFDTLSIEPEIKQTMPDTSVLKYEWYAYYTDNPRMQRTVLSHSRRLNTQIGFAPQSSLYDLVFKVTDTTTGVSAFQYYKVKVSTLLSSGWLILEHGDDQADVDIITPGGSVYYHIFSTANPDKKLPLTTDIIASLYTNWGHFNYIFFEDGGYLVNRNSFVVISDYANLFYNAPEVLHPELVVYPGSTNSFVINDSLIYNQNFLYGGTHFGARYAGDYRAAPFIEESVYYDAFFFDDKNKRFVYVGPNGTSISTFSVRDPSQAFDLNHVPKEILTMLPSNHDNIISLFKNEHNDSAFLYTVNLRDDRVAIDSQVVLNSPGISSGTSFAASLTVPLLYYTVDNKIYVYDIPANRSRKIYEFSGEQITVMKKSGDHLYVATFDGTEGRVYYMNISPTGDISNNTYSKKFEGFGKVVDMAYKNG